MDDQTRDLYKSLRHVGRGQCTIEASGTTAGLPRKREVIEYLRGNTLVAMCAGWMTDEITGEQVSGWRDNVRCDDAYSWGESIAYYLDKYDAELPADFLAHIYEKIGA